MFLLILQHLILPIRRDFRFVSQFLLLFVFVPLQPDYGLLLVVRCPHRGVNRMLAVDHHSKATMLDAYRDCFSPARESCKVVVNPIKLQ